MWLVRPRDFGELYLRRAAREFKEHHFGYSGDCGLCNRHPADRDPAGDFEGQGACTWVSTRTLSQFRQGCWPVHIERQPCGKTAANYSPRAGYQGCAED
jgi:hypothetical protein